MDHSVDAGARTGAPRGRHVPAYGPVDAALGFALFYVLVARSTPTVVAVLPDVTGVSASLVRLGLAAVLWFVLAVTVVDQVRRQLAALGIGSHDAVRRDARSRAVPSGTRTLAYLALALLGGVVAAWTFDRAIETVTSLLPAVATLDAGAFALGEVAVMAAFFVSFGVATHALDRLLIGGVRALLSG